MFFYAGMGITKEILGLLSRAMHWPCWIWMDWISVFSIMYNAGPFYVFVKLIDKLFNILLTSYELLMNILLTFYELTELIVNLL